MFTMKYGCSIYYVYFLIVTPINAQLNNVQNEHIIWGASPINNELTNNYKLVDKNWGKLPSQQDKKDIWGKAVTELNTVTPKTKTLNGKKYVVNENNIVLYDEDLINTLDSLQAINEMDVTAIAPPPEDPQDVPLDKVTFLRFIAALAMKYYKNSEPN